MMYNAKIVAVVKSGGKVLREHGNVIYLPFGAEYSILIKNLNTVRADVRITIDGEDVMNGNSIIVNANDSVELERYLKDLDRGNRFKFIERSESVEQHRGVGVEDGLIRIEYQFEKPYVVPSDPWWTNNHPWTDPWGPKVRYYGDDVAYKGTSRNVFRDGLNTTTIGTSDVSFSANSISTQSVPLSSQTHDSNPVNEVGITVPGSISDQKFRTVAPLNLESETHAIVLQIRGETETKKVVAPVTVKHKPKCQTCGRVNKATAKFCTNCGTSLEIV